MGVLNNKPRVEEEFFLETRGLDLCLLPLKKRETLNCTNFDLKSSNSTSCRNVYEKI